LLEDRFAPAVERETTQPSLSILARKLSYRGMMIIRKLLRLAKNK
jgi:hypothetical protein